MPGAVREEHTLAAAVNLVKQSSRQMTAHTVSLLEISGNSWLMVNSLLYATKDAQKNMSCESFQLRLGLCFMHCLAGEH